MLALGVMTRFFTDLGTASGRPAAIAVGAWRVRHGEMSLEALLIILMAGTEIFRPLRDLRSVLHQGMVGQSAASAVLALLEAKSDAPAGGAPHQQDLTPSITFEAVGFAYKGRRGDAHAGLSFAIAAGETVGIVGPSGAGKSTILRLLLRQHDAQAGTIRIGGHDIRTLDPDQVRGIIAIVAQDTTLFDGTVADNLRLGRSDATEADMIAAARAANAHDFISALPQGYKTRIGERGATLSGGQRQRVAIARALLRNAPILILDEALSSVDAENEAVIQQALDRLMQGRTTVILAHRLSSVIGADRILVLDHGRVVESGAHAELIARPGVYRQLMAPQLGSAAAQPVETIERVWPVAASVGPEVRPLSEDAAEIGWRETLRTLLRFIQPWRASLVLTILCGIGRVLAFIGVSVLGALVIAAVASDQPVLGLLVALLLAAPVAATLHWLESWLAHAMAYRLLAEMRIALFAKLDRLAPAYLLQRRSGDLVALATQDVETVEYFYAHTVAPAFVAVLIPTGVLALLAWIAWPLALVLLPFLAWAGLAPVFARGEIDRLGSEARDALGRIGAHLTETIQGLAELDSVPGHQTAAGRVFSRHRGLPEETPGIIARSGHTNRRRWRSQWASAASRWPCWGPCFPPRAGSPINGCRCWCWCRPRPSCQSPKSARSGGNSPILSPRPGGCMSSSPSRSRSPTDLTGAREPGGAIRGGALHLSWPRRVGPGWRGVRDAAGQHGGRGRRVGRRKIDRRQPAAAFLGPAGRPHHARRQRSPPAAAG